MTNVLSVFFIDDNKDEVIPIIKRLDKRFFNSTFESNFEKGLKTLKNKKFDVLVLDWNQSKDKDDFTGGQDLISQIWKEAFLPVIIYTGRSEAAKDYLADNDMDNHPLIHVETKGSINNILSKINEMSKHARILQNIKEDMNIASREACRVFDEYSNNIDKGIIKYLFLKRVNNYFELNNIDDSFPPSYQYVYPPVTKSLRSCDIIESLENNKKYIIFSPSCDIVTGRNKISNILCCEIIEDNIYEQLQLSFPPSMKKTKIIKRVEDSINQGIIDKFAILPKYSNIIKTSLVNLKSNLLIPIDEIYPFVEDDFKYKRIISIISPFRERLISHYNSINSRIGVPDINKEDFMKEIKYATTQNTSD